MSPAWRSVRGGRLILVTTCLIVVVLLFVFVVVVPHHSSALHSAISVSYTSVASLLRRRPAPVRQSYLISLLGGEFAGPENEHLILQTTGV